MLGREIENAEVQRHWMPWRALSYCNGYVLIGLEAVLTQDGGV
jgi:hypothetical protein